MARASAPSGKDAGAPAVASRRPARKRPIGLAALRGFESAARHLSFTEAAAELHLTQSAISRQVAALESDVGQRLFVRKTRALLLTAAGERMARAARQALGTVDRTVDEIRGQAASPRVVVTTYPSFASMWLVPRLAAFQRDHPGVEIRVDAQGRRVDLEAEGIDIALRRCRPQDAPPDAVRLVDEDITPAMSPELLNRHGGRLASAADLLKLPLIEIEEDLPNDTSGWSRWFEFAGVEAGAQASSPVMVVAYIDQSMQAAIRGQGVVLAYRPLRDDAVAAGHLTMPFPDLRLATRYAMHLIVNPASRARAGVIALRNWLLDEFQRGPARQS
jgi:DNA-binding transcriptional LysR family regulator